MHEKSPRVFWKEKTAYFIHAKIRMHSEKSTVLYMQISSCVFVEYIGLFARMK